MSSPIDPGNPFGSENRVSPRPEIRVARSPKITAESFALALLVTSSLQIMENLIPRIPLFPWMRVGFSYVIILPFLLELGPGAALALLLARNLTAILYGGQPFTTFLIGTGAGAIAIFGLGPMVRFGYKRGWLGIPGASVLLAAGFNMAQLALVKSTLIRHAGFYFLIGPMLAWSLLSGLLVALLIRYSAADLEGMLLSGPGIRPPSNLNVTPLEKPAGRWGHWPFVLGLFLLAGLFASKSFYVQGAAFGLLLATSRDRGKILWQSWPFFFYLAYLDLFHTQGVYWIGDWITREGAARFVLQTARLANFILLGRWLSVHFPWGWARRSQSPYLQGFLFSLPLMSGIFKSSLEFGREMGRRLWSGQREGILTHAFDAWRNRMHAAAVSEISGIERLPEAGELKSTVRPPGP